jgi:hypothetical protein
VTEIKAQDLLSETYDGSISSRALLHMDQCIYNYKSNNANTDDIITNMLRIAQSYITREDIIEVNDIKPYHQYVIMKASDILQANEIDVIIVSLFSLLNHLELVE